MFFKKVFLKVSQNLENFIRTEPPVQAGFPTSIENMGGGGSAPPTGGRAFQNLMGGLSQYMGEYEGGLKMLSKNTCEGVHLIVKLPAIILQACKFTKNELLHTHFSMVFARF